MSEIVLPISSIIFYAFAALLVFSALMVVASTHPVRAALFLVLAFFASAGLWLFAHAEFLALVLVLVYVGAVMTLFLFVVMTLNLHVAVDRRHFLRYSPLGVLIVALVVALVVYVSGPTHFGLIAPTMIRAAENNNTQWLGSVLYTQYAYPFELAGVLLLVAIVAAISLSAPVQRNRKIQQPAAQINVRATDRVRLIDMPTEKKSSGDAP